MSDSEQPTSEAAAEAGRRARRLPFFGKARGAFRFAMLADARWIAISAAFEREMEEGRGFLWLPVLFGIGILGYIALPREPSLIALGLLTAVLAGATIAARRGIASLRILFALTAVVAGATAMKARTDYVSAPMLIRETTATITGWVASREESSRNGTRLVVRVHDIGGMPEKDLPRLARFTIHGQASSPAVGDAISAKVRLQPPSGPAMPGAFDFGEAAFYAQIGAIGFAYGAPKASDIGPAPPAIRWQEPLAALRDTIRVRIEEALPGDNGHIAAALIMGDQRGISQQVQDDMRASGLGHILSISGLHLALVAGSVFWLIRALLALFPGVALRYPIKKWAAAGALAVATFYLGISGAEVATVRSFVMLAIMLIAIMVDRRALTLRNVALAALLILVVNPDSLLSISFQMSFAATIALVAGYEAMAARTDRGLPLGRKDPTVFSRVREGLTALLLTSLLAGLATAPFGIFHFQRLAPLTLLANVAAGPVVGIVVMPMALAAVILMPFGLETLPLHVMSLGLDWLIAVAARTAEWSAGLGDVRLPPASALVLVVGGFLWLALWRERWRLAGILPMAVAIPIALFAPRPAILVDASGNAAAVRAEDGRYRILGGRNASFEVENWLRADADPRPPKAKELHEGVACDSLGCIAQLGASGGAVALVLKPDAFAEDCRRAAVVVTALKAPAWCRDQATVIDRQSLAEGGAAALFLQDARAPPASRFRVETTYPPIRRSFMPPVEASPSSGG